jgi:hypothetical protein
MIFLSNRCSPCRMLSGGDRCDIVALQEADTLAPQRQPHRFQMHQVGAAADLDVALDRRMREGVEQPARVLIRYQPVPFAPDDRDRRAQLRRIVGELAVPMETSRRARKALRAAAESRFAWPAGSAGTAIGLREVPECGNALPADRALVMNPSHQLPS